MPRFFLHVRQGQELILDPEGSELPDLVAAQHEARLSLRELVAGCLRSSGSSSRITDVQQIEIADQAGQVLATVHFLGARTDRVSGAYRMCGGPLRVKAHLQFWH
ncbi:hypothetical protein JMJ56_30665 [Belnapia sp. T18]|uniref:DUF6894 domain-containing protein n=1 Tax=Belnapia arida TaxID=2804533 RepID=A0ABS1UCC9_9PROT|nr:hypothetical protein [Belnapia arida]MBL6082339.1 hypothetical protein [Belnapia arida]